jgi:hypothetical protein
MQQVVSPFSRKIDVGAAGKMGQSQEKATLRLQNETTTTNDS